MRKRNLFNVIHKPYPVIPSEHFYETMQETVLPFLDEHRKPFTLRAAGGQRLYGEYYAPAQNQKGTILISHGFSENGDKYRELIYYFLREGYCVCIYDHRDHGRSRAVTGGEAATHVERFGDYVSDMAQVVQRMLCQLPKPYFLYCHSMGSGIGAAYVEAHPEVFCKVIFNAPMFAVNTGIIPPVIAEAVGTLMCLLGQGRQFLFGHTAFDGREDFEHSAGTDFARYRYYYLHQISHPQLQNGGASFRWVLESLRGCDRLMKKKNLAKITAPSLIFQADRDDYVHPSGQERFAANAPDAEILFVPGSKHEIYMSDAQTLKFYVQAVMDFYSPGGL